MANHSHECETADVGSFCDCDCAGSKHAVKRTVGGVSGAGGVSKAARAAAEKAGVTPVVNNRAVPADGHRVAPSAPKSFKAAHAEHTAKQDAGKKALAQQGKDIAAHRETAEDTFRKAVAGSEAWSRGQLAKIKADNPGMSTADAIKKGRTDPEFKKRLAAHHEAFAQARRDGLNNRDIDRVVAEERKKADKAQFGNPAEKPTAEKTAKPAGNAAGKAPASAKDLTPEQANVLTLIGERYQQPKVDGSTAGMDPAAIDQLVKAGAIRRSAGDGPTVHLERAGHALLADLRGDDKHKAMLAEWNAASEASRKVAEPWRAARDANDEAKMERLDPALREAGGRDTAAQNAIVRHVRDTAAALSKRKPAREKTAGRATLAGGGAAGNVAGGKTEATAVKVPAPLRDILAVVDNPDKHMDTAAAARYQKLTREHMKLMTPEQKQGMLDDLRSRAANGYKPQSPTGQKLNRAFNTLAFAGSDFKVGMKAGPKHQAGVGNSVTHAEHGHGRVVSTDNTARTATVDFGDKKVAVAQDSLTFGHVGDDVNPDAKAAGREASKASASVTAARTKKATLAHAFATDRHGSKAATDALLDAEVSADDFASFTPAVQAATRKRMEDLAGGQYVDPALKARAAATLKRWDGDTGEAAASDARKAAAPAPMAKLAQEHLDGKGGYLTSFNKMAEYPKTSFDALSPEGKKAVTAALEKEAARGGDSGRRAARKMQEWTGNTVDVKPDPMPDHVRQAHRALDGQSTTLPRSMVYGQQNEAVLRAHFTPEERAKMRADGGRILAGMRDDAPDRKGLAAAMDRIDAIDGPPGAKTDDAAVSTTSSRRGRSTPVAEKTTAPPAKTPADAGESVKTADNLSLKELRIKAREAELRSMRKDLPFEQRDAARQQMHDLEKQAFELENPRRTAGPGASKRPVGNVAGRPASVADIQPGFTYIDYRGATVTVTETPGKIKSFRVMASDRPGRPLIITPTQLAAATGLPRGDAGNAAGGPQSAALRAAIAGLDGSATGSQSADAYSRLTPSDWSKMTEQQRHDVAEDLISMANNDDIRPATPAGKAVAKARKTLLGLPHDTKAGTPVDRTHNPAAPGDPVVHESRGRGVVLNVSASGLTVQFDNGQRTQVPHDQLRHGDPGKGDAGAAPATDPIAAKEAEVKRLSDAYVAHGRAQAGSGSMRTKRFGQQVDAHLKRSVAMGEQLKKAEAELAALKNPKPQSATAKPAGSFTPDDLDGKKFIKTRYGWFEVVKVNRTSVKVKGGQGPGNPESILIKKIIDAR